MDANISEMICGSWWTFHHFFQLEFWKNRIAVNHLGVFVKEVAPEACLTTVDMYDVGVEKEAYNQLVPRFVAKKHVKLSSFKKSHQET